MGYWEFTASIDWCEENYTMSFYIAEFWNTISSISMIICGMYIRDKSLSRLMSLVGVGSVFFHMTLSRYAQALDEVPMIWLSLMLIKRCLEKLNFTFASTTRNILGIIYGISSSYFITVHSSRSQFKMFHTLNTFVTVLVVFLYRILASRHVILFETYIAATNWFGLGAVLWVIDLFLCKYIEPIPLHAMWHVCSTLGVYKLVDMLNLNKNILYDYDR